MYIKHVHNMYISAGVPTESKTPPLPYRAHSVAGNIGKGNRS